MVLPKYSLGQQEETACRAWVVNYMEWKKCCLMPASIFMSAGTLPAPCKTLWLWKHEGWVTPGWESAAECSVLACMVSSWETWQLCLGPEYPF